MPVENLNVPVNPGRGKAITVQQMAELCNELVDDESGECLITVLLRQGEVAENKPAVLGGVYADDVNHAAGVLLLRIVGTMWAMSSFQETMNHLKLEV